MTKIWTQNNTIEEALSLPEGSYAADFGFLVQQSVSPDSTLTAAQTIIDNQIQCTVASQAAIIVKAKESGVAFQNWADIKLM